MSHRRTLLQTAVAIPVIATGPLLRRMRSDLLTYGRFSRPTATAMYGLYATHAATFTAAAVRRPGPLPPSVASTGPPLIVAGTALTVAGMRRFVGPGQVTGTNAGDLVSGGVYRFSRNPQYVGYVLALTGLALGRRSSAALALAAAAAAVYHWWVPVEEMALRHTFGQPYDDYLHTAPRWLGVPGSR